MDGKQKLTYAMSSFFYKTREIHAKTFYLGDRGRKRSYQAALQTIWCLVIILIENNITLKTLMPPLFIIVFLFTSKYDLPSLAITLIHEILGQNRRPNNLLRENTIFAYFGTQNRAKLEDKNN